MRELRENILPMVFMIAALYSASCKSDALGVEPLSQTDEVNVNILSGRPQFNIKTLEIGTLQHFITSEGAVIAPLDNFSGYSYKYNAALNVSGYKCNKSEYFYYGDGGALFCFNGSIWLNGKGQQHTLEQNGVDYILTDESGVRYHFIEFSDTSSTKILNKIERINGEVIRIYHRTAKNSKGHVLHRIQSVNSNLGYQLKYEYPEINIGIANQADFVAFSKVTGINNLYQYCSIDENVSCPSSTYNWPKAEFNYNSTSQVLTLTDFSNRIYTFTHSSFGVSKLVTSYNDGFHTTNYTYGDTWAMVGSPGSAYPPAMILGKTDIVMKTEQNGREWLYSYQSAGPYNFQTQSTSTEGQRVTVLSNTADGQNNPVTVNTIDGTRFVLDSNINSRINRIYMPEGYTKSFTYDLRGNVVKIERTHSDMALTSTQADYSSSCLNKSVCNKPNWVSDAKGSKTYYTYYDTGLLKSVTSPVNREGLKAQTRYYYREIFPSLLSSSGTLIKSERPLWVLDREASCRTSNPMGGACSKSGDETVISYEYDDNGGNNVLPIAKVISSNGTTKRWCYKYDEFGNIISETSPIANLSSCGE